ncbi:MAG TPA: SDR family oxidoreductase [Gemmatimonadales bacterium]|jgi:NAD(P)-dependent dehydrogenase (short-subunit alcohol dehydrogenase family)
MSVTGLRGKVALVTGAASGIGSASAIALAGEGMRVIATDLESAGAARTLERAVGEGHRSRRLDVTSEENWETVLAELGPDGLDVLVNAAGISYGADITETTLAEWRRVLAVNLDGIFLGLRHAVPLMRRQGRGGAVINIASASGLKAAAGASAYCASKAAVVMLSRVAALECSRDRTGIRVNSLLPGAVRTPMWRTMPFFQQLIAEHPSEDAAWSAFAANLPMGRFAEPEEIAAAVVYLASDPARYVTGTELIIDGGYRT